MRYYARAMMSSVSLRKQLSSIRAWRVSDPFRRLSTGSVVAATILGLPTALWTYKCLVMVLFQRKIIYMGGVPLGSRTERLCNRDPALRIEEVRLPSTDGVSLSGIVVSRAKMADIPPRLVIMYLQGNAGNPLHRIPKFRTLVHLIDDPIAVVAIAPRSYWTSTNRSPSEQGLRADYTSPLNWIDARYPRSRVVVYGHSLGGSIAAGIPPRNGLVLENAFTSVPDMVKCMYPSRWIPYHHLGRFVWDTWDAIGALRARRAGEKVLILNSARDELVPPEMGERLLDALSGGAQARRVVVPFALHDDAYTRWRWREAMRLFLVDVLSSDKSDRR